MIERGFEKNIFDWKTVQKIWSLSKKNWSHTWYDLNFQPFIFWHVFKVPPNWMSRGQRFESLMFCLCTGCLKWNPPFWDECYNCIVQLGQKIKLNPSMGQKQYLKSCFRIRIFWKLCPVVGSDYQNLVKNWRTFLNLSPT